MSSSERQFKIAIPESELTKLHSKLAAATFPDELEESGWSRGVPLEDLKRLVSYWKEGFNWRAQEEHINRTLPQFTRDIEVTGFGNLNIHYVHARSRLVDAIPLLFVHGWPGSFLEVEKILPLLTAVDQNGTHPSFHVVALSLPGFGFSDTPKRKGFHGRQMAEVAHKLMLALGYNEYVTQGGDIGYTVTREIAIKYGPKHSKAWHTNFAKADPPQLTSSPLPYIQDMLTPYTLREQADLKRSQWFIKDGSGYKAEHSTMPQTIGYSFADSPVGLLAWIYEKLVLWTDSYPWTDDEVLTFISIYWFSRAGPAASIRFYYEQRDQDVMSGRQPTIPMGVSRFPKELSLPRISWVRRTGRVVQLSEHEKGGHFAAHEQPQKLVEDVRKMFMKGGPAFGVVQRHSGYGAKL